MAYHWINNHKVDWKRGEVEVVHQVRSVEPRAMSVLRVLVVANGGVVTQQQLLDEVWGDIVVAPNALQRCIAQLRKTFNDDAKQQSVIKTHPKLGYSLVATISDKAQPANLPVNILLRLKTTLIMLFTAGIIGTLFYFIAGKQQTPSLSHITMITSDEEPQYGGVIVSDTLYFIQGDKPNHQQLMAKNLVSNRIKKVAQRQWFYGELNVSQDNKTLFYSTVMHKENNTKCSNIVALTIESMSSDVVLACDKGFKFNAQSIDGSTLLYLHQVNDEAAQLVMRNLSNSQNIAVNHSLGKVVSLKVNAFNQYIAVVSQQNNQFYLNIATLDQHRLVLQHRWSIAKVLAQSQPYWHDAAKVYMASEQVINWFTPAGQRGELALPSKDSLYNVLNYDDRLLIELGRDDWDVSQRAFLKNHSNKTLSRSIYADYSGSYRPLHDEYSFISNRSGVAQLWLQEKDQLRQVTSGQQDVQSYVWSANGEDVAVVSHGELSIINVNGDVTKVATAKPVQEIYQWIRSNNDEHSLLMATGLADNQQLISVNVRDGSIKVIVNMPTQWAQWISDDFYVTNSPEGYLQSIVISNEKVTVSPLEKTKALKLQWRFFEREGKLYFQDKSKNIWQFELATDQLTIVGNYDEASLLMTDIDPKQQLFLSDTLSRKIRDLAFVD